MKTFLLRSFSTVVLLTLFFCAVFLRNQIGSNLFAVLVILMSFFATAELSSMLNKAGHGVSVWPVSFLCALTPIFLLCHKSVFAVALFLLVCAYTYLALLLSVNREDRMCKALNSLAVYVLMTIPILCIVFIYQSSVRGPSLFFYLVLTTKMSDIAAYVTGTLSNVVTKGHNHKLIPSVSPGKSWEGAIGGFLLTLVLSWFVWPYSGIRMPQYFALILGAVLFFGSVVGDLAESSVKRTCKIKDSGHYLPGIGGILDLVDSLMVNSILFFVLLLLRVIR